MHQDGLGTIGGLLQPAQDDWSCTGTVMLSDFADPVELGLNYTSWIQYSNMVLCGCHT